jgi:uncharacterized protein
MELMAEHGRRVPLKDMGTTEQLAHASIQARKKKYDEMLIVDVDSHHAESQNHDEIFEFIESPVIKQVLQQGRIIRRGTLMPNGLGYQDTGGRVARYAMRGEKTPPGIQRDAVIGQRWMDAMGVDYSCIFPTSMLNIGMHPETAIEIELCWAYNRWVTERLLPDSDGRLYSMLCLPFSDPAACLRQVEEFGHRKGVVGFMVTTVRHLPVHHDNYMKLYRAMEERGLSLSFHSGFNWMEPIFKNCNRFISVHALGFTVYNMVHMTNWVVNGMNERFPKLPVIWIEAGLAWIPFLMQRLDHEFMLRASECPLLKRKPSEYMAEMYYSTQPIETQNMKAMELTFEMFNAETQLLYSSDYPHWDFDLPSTIYDLPFLTDKARHNILGGNAARLFKLPPRNDRQRENLERFGNLVAS